MSFWNSVNKVIGEADVLLLVLDSRMVDETKHKEIEDKVDKPLIYVITKSDLIGQEESEKIKRSLPGSVFVSAKEFHGTKILREKILIAASRSGVKNPKVGVLGYPNVGKSTLINAMAGRHSASTSSMSGHTKGIQKIRADNRIVFLDTPGVIPFRETIEEKHALVGSVDYTKVKDPDMAVYEIQKKFPGQLESFYEISGDVIEGVALKFNLIRKGGVPDEDRAARKILKDWQEGKISSI